MNFYPASPLSLICFLGICLASLMVFIYLYKSLELDRWTLKVYFALIALMSFSAESGLSLKYPIPLLPVFVIGILIFGVIFAFSENGEKIGKAFPLWLLIGFQGFRFPLEIILHNWAGTGTIPVEMTWSGQNWDVYAGVVCLIFIPILVSKPKLAWFPQWIGFLLLLNVLRVVVMTSPLPISWDLERPLLLAMHFPYLLIAPLLVLPAFTAHLITFRKLMNGY